MAKTQVSLTVNGAQVDALVEPRTLLIHFLREQLSLTGAHIGCETSHCGACTVDLDGKSVKSCTMFAVQANGADRSTDVEPRMLLAHLIREEFRLTGTHVGCDTTSCGACTVLLDGRPIKSCTMFAVQADGREVTTVEGLFQEGQLHAIQAAFKEEHGLQCGFCTPGMMLTGSALLAENPAPSEDEVRWAISGNLCRCTGYQNIVKSIQYAAAKLNGVAFLEAAE